MDANTIVNGAYHSAVLSGLVMTNSILAKKLLKVNPANLGMLNIKDALMLTTNVYISMMIKSALITQGILPANINIPTQN